MYMYVKQVLLKDRLAHRENIHTSFEPSFIGGLHLTKKSNQLWIVKMREKKKVSADSAEMFAGIHVCRLSGGY